MILFTLPGRGVMTTTRSARKTASLMLWVMRRQVFLVSCQIRNNSRFMASRVRASSAPKGSSIRRSGGLWINARLMDTRCCMPPESSFGYLVSNPSRPVTLISSIARFEYSSSSNPGISTGSMTLSNTFRHFGRTGAWKTIPTSGQGTRHVVTVDLHHSSGLWKKARYDLEQGGLPAAALADDGDEFLVLYVQVDIVQRVNVAVLRDISLIEVLDFNNRFPAHHKHLHPRSRRSSTRQTAACDPLSQESHIPLQQ